MRRVMSLFRSRERDARKKRVQKKRSDSFSDCGSETEEIDILRYGGRRCDASVSVGSSNDMSSDSLDMVEEVERFTYKAPDRLRWSPVLESFAPDAPHTVDPILWWSRQERREQLVTQQRIVDIEVSRRKKSEPCDPIPGESRRGLGISCEHSTPHQRAQRIAWTRRDIIETSQSTSPEDLAYFAAALAHDAVEAARTVARNDRFAIEPPRDLPKIALSPLSRSGRSFSNASSDGAFTNKLIRNDSLDALIECDTLSESWNSMDTTSYSHSQASSLSESPPVF